MAISVPGRGAGVGDSVGEAQVREYTCPAPLIMSLARRPPYPPLVTSRPVPGHVTNTALKITQQYNANNIPYNFSYISLSLHSLFLPRIEMVKCIDSFRMSSRIFFICPCPSSRGRRPNAKTVPGRVPGAEAWH